MAKLPLKAHRAMKDMSQQEVAEKVGVDRNTYASWEKYETFPSAIQLMQLAEVFGCSLDDILILTN